MPYVLAAMIAASPSSYDANYLSPVPVVQTEQRWEGEFRLTAYSCYTEPCVNSLGRHPEYGDVGVPMQGPAAWPLGTVIEIEGLGVFTTRDRCPG